MIKLNPNDINTILLRKIAPNAYSRFDWECTLCGRQHYQEEKRNLFRRKYVCLCQKLNKQIEEINTNLVSVNYIFLFQDANSYTISEKEKIINTLKPIKVKCLKCGKESLEYYNNIKSGHKKCNCNELKQFTRDYNIQDFIAKWHPLNQLNFELVFDNIENISNPKRNQKFTIKCRKCGRTDERWGITLIDNPVACKYCEILSTGELMVSFILDFYNINYIREYNVNYKNHLHKFDFYLPNYNIYIEYNGLQHYIPIEYFGGEERFLKQQERDKEKIEYCNEKNAQLIIFTYSQTLDEIKDIIGRMFNDYPEKEYIQVDGKGVEKDIV